MDSLGNVPEQRGGRAVYSSAPMATCLEFHHMDSLGNVPEQRGGRAVYSSAPMATCLEFHHVNQHTC